MHEDQYSELMTYYSQPKEKSNITKALSEVLPIIVLVFYPIQLLSLLFKNGFEKGIANEQFLKFLIIPTAFIILVTIAKYILGSKNILFPSITTSFAYVVGMGFLYLNTGLGIIMLTIGSLIGVTRLMSEKHTYKEVLFGGLLGITLGVIFFLI